MTGHVSPLWACAALILIAAWLLSRITAWLSGQYEVTAASPWRFRLTRRWYGIRAHVLCRDCGDVYEVRDFSDDSTAVPWLLVSNTDDDTGEDVFWEPVTGFTPYAVRRFRPRLIRYGRLFWYETLPVTVPQDSPAGES